MIKRCFLLLILLLSASCGYGWDHKAECLDGCDRTSPENRRTGEVVYVPGPPGKDGSDGYSTVFLIGPAPSSACLYGGSTFFVALDVNRNGSLDLLEDGDIQSATVCNGASGTDGTNGVDGKDGTNGVDGVDGKDGVNGVDGTNGTDGKDGTNGTDGKDASQTSLAPVIVIDPCGDSPDTLDEVLLSLADGTVLASRTDSPNGKSIRLAILPPGDHVTVDGSGCHFSVDDLGNISGEYY